MAANYVWCLKDNIPYVQHLQNNRYIAEISKKSAISNTRSAAFTAKANLKSGKIIGNAIEKANRLQDQRSFEINSAIVNQTRVIGMGMKVLDDSLKDGFFRVSSDLCNLSSAVKHVSLEVSKVNENVIKVGKELASGISGLKSSFDMGMSSIVSQFELQRDEIKDGLQNIADILRNRRKTESYELFNDAKIAFEKFLQYPEEKQFLEDTIEYLVKSIEIYKGNPFTYLYLGHAYKETSKEDDLLLSLESFKKCATYSKGIDNKELTGLAYFLAGWLSYVTNNVDEAIDLTKLAIKFDKHSYPEAYYNLAKFYANQGKAKSSLKYLNIAISKYDPFYILKPLYDKDFDNIKSEFSEFCLLLRDTQRDKFDAKLSKFYPLA